MSESEIYGQKTGGGLLLNNNTPKAELKNCPFCGGEALLHPKLTRINCTECPAVMNGVQGRLLLIKAWNTRQSDLREQLEQAFMAGQADEGIDPSYSNAQAYAKSIIDNP